MCLILFAIGKHPDYKLIIAANRDEYYDRPTAPASFWEDAPHVLAGRDLRAGGTWFGVTRGGRIGAITNYRDPASLKENSPSRGRLVSGFLSGNEDPVDFLGNLERKAERYNGFNLLMGVKDRIYWYSNRGDGIHRLRPGIYGLSNHLLNTPWPKVTRGKNAIAGIISDSKAFSLEGLFHLLQDRTRADDESLPDTGVDLEWERILSPIFISSPVYGTRSSTLLLMDKEGHVTFVERTFHPGEGGTESVKYEFLIEP